MTFTYSGDPSSSPLDAVRWLCGDVNKEYPLAQDAEILFSISQEANLYNAAAAVCSAIAAEFSRKVDKSLGDLRLSMSQQAQAYRTAAVELRSRASLRISPIYVGGLSKSELAADLASGDLVSPFFRRDQFENIGSGIMTPSLRDIHEF